MKIVQQSQQNSGQTDFNLAPKKHKIFSLLPVIQSPMESYSSTVTYYDINSQPFLERGKGFLERSVTLFQPGEGRLSPPITLGPPNLFSFRHHCYVVISSGYEEPMLDLELIGVIQQADGATTV